MNEKDIRGALNRRLSALDASSERRERIRERIARQEEPKMKKKLSLALVCAISLILAAAVAMASGALFSREVDAAQLADEALLQKYGITAEMLTYFRRTVGEAEGEPQVRYDGMEGFTYVLGSYNVLIRGGKAEASWSRKGTSTAGGFEADAWGADQLAEMLRINKETLSLSPFAEKAAQIAAAHGVNEYEGSGMPDEATILARQLKQAENAEKARAAAKLTPAQMEEIARDALAVRYGLQEKQLACLTWQEESSWYRLLGEKELPCYEFYFTLGSDEDGYEGDGCGVYMVAVNVETGVVEDILYDSGLSANG